MMLALWNIREELSRCFWRWWQALLLLLIRYLDKTLVCAYTVQGCSRRVLPCVVNYAMVRS
jgi:hypothetical protein